MKLRVFRANSKPSRLLDRFRTCTSGATAIEYCLLASLLAITAVTGVTVFGSSMTGMYAHIGSAMRTMP